MSVLVILNGELVMVTPSLRKVSKRVLGVFALIVTCTSCEDASEVGESVTAVESRSPQSGSDAALEPRAPAVKTQLSAAKPAMTPTKTKGVMSQVPIKLGYYADMYGTCEKPSHMVKIEGDGYWELFADAADSFRMEFGKVTRSMEGGRASYFAEFGGKDAEDCSEDEPCISGVGFTPVGGDRLDISIQDTATFRYCSPEKIPKNFRR